MDARLIRLAALASLLLVSMGARFQSANFIVETGDPRLAAQFAQASEKYRHDLAVEWLGKAMPNWAQPCMMTVQVGPNLGAGGATTFIFDHGEVFGWRMSIQGSAERVLDSVLPHEITHMVFASHFRRPLPRWADEGGATNVECGSEKQKHRAMLIQFLRTNRGIAFGQMFAMTEYPRDVMPLYAQSYSLAEYLIMQGGRRKYVEFLSDGMRSGNWPAAVQRHYGIHDLATLQNTWVAWVGQGSPVLNRGETSLAAASVSPAAAAIPATSAAVDGNGTSLAASGRRARPEPNLLYRVNEKSRDGRGTAVAGESPAASSANVAGAAATPPAGASQATALPPVGWRAAADAASATQRAAAQPLPSPVVPASTEGATQVARPQPMEPAREIILEWNR